MSLQNSSVASTTNLLIPSSGGTHAVPFFGPLPTTPTLIDWRQFAIDNFPFSPQGVYVDNTLGESDVIINFQPLNWTINVPPGNTLQSGFPAASGQTTYISGDGINDVNVIFVDYPVLPSGTNVNVGGVVSATISGPNPLPVVPTVSVGGQPYLTTQQPIVATPYLASISAAGNPAGTSAEINPTAGTYLRELILDVAPANTNTNYNISVEQDTINIWTATITAQTINTQYKFKFENYILAPVINNLTVTLNNPAQSQIFVTAFYG